MPGFFILFRIIALSRSGVDISTKYANARGPRYIGRKPSISVIKLFKI